MTGNDDVLFVRAGRIREVAYLRSRRPGMVRPTDATTFNAVLAAAADLGVAAR